MLYVGLTDDHKESANMFGNVVGSQVISQLIKTSNKAVRKRPGHYSVHIALCKYISLLILFFMTLMALLIVNLAFQ